MSTPFNYDDLYEEFQHYTSDSHSSSSNSQQDIPDSIRVMSESQEESRQGSGTPAQEPSEEEQHVQQYLKMFPGPSWAATVIQEHLQRQCSQQQQQALSNMEIPPGAEVGVNSQTPEPAEISNPSTPGSCSSRSTTTPDPVPDCYIQEDQNNTFEMYYPGGIEAIWKNVPQAFRGMISPSDIPLMAQQRGYFTVSELLTLKRTLVVRYNAAHPDEPFCPSVVNQFLGIGNEPPQKRCRVVTTRASESPMVSESSLPTCSNPQPLMPRTVFTLENIAQPLQGPSNSSTNQVSMLPSIVSQQPPPYRTATLVLRHLQIGNCIFRSYSEMIPNRLRVMFNTQRLLYECQLPIVPPMRENFQALRKVLTIDISFDQITLISVGVDKLYLRVEGAPEITITYNPVVGGDKNVLITHQDKFFLDQIEEGQLRLSSCHQLVFLSERQAHSLVCHFKEFPRFQDIIKKLPDGL